MTVPKNKREGNVKINRIDLDQGQYTIIHNDLINDNEVSLAARMALIFLLSKPKDWFTSWTILGKTFGVHRETIRKYFTELENNDYVIVGGQKNEKGVFLGCDLLISSVKIDRVEFYRHGKKPLRKKTDTEKNVTYKDRDSTNTYSFTNTDQTEREKPAPDLNNLSKEKVKPDDYRLLTNEGKKIFDLLEQTAIELNIEPINTDKALVFAQERDFNYVQHKIAVLKVKLERGEQILKPSAYLIGLIEGNYKPVEKKKEEVILEEPKKPPFEGEFYKFFERLGLIAASQRVRDKHREIAKKLLYKFFWCENSGGSEDIQDFTSSCSKLKSYCNDNDALKHLIITFHYPNKEWSSHLNKNKFLDFWEEL